jgi:hypothetical protein
MDSTLKYFLSCFLLLIPILFWNVIFAPSLPPAYSMEVFWKDIPPFIGTMENVLRGVVIFLPLLMPLRVKSRSQRTGVVVFIVGAVIYFASWLVLIDAPDSAWSHSIIGFMAPAYTAIVWLTGIGLIGETLFVRIPYHPALYLGLSGLFVVFHSVHSYIVFARLH